MLKKRSSRRLVIPLGIKVRASICNGNFSRFHESTTDKFELQRGRREETADSPQLLPPFFPDVTLRRRGRQRAREEGGGEREWRVLFAVYLSIKTTTTTTGAAIADAKLKGARGSNCPEKENLLPTASRKKRAREKETG